MDGEDGAIGEKLDRARRSVIIREGLRARGSNYATAGAIIPAGGPIPIPFERLLADRPTIVIFADDDPLKNWTHPCRYLLCDAETGKVYREVESRFPPVDPTLDRSIGLRPFHQPMQFAPRQNFPIPSQADWRPIGRGRRLAILFAGLSNRRHVNCMEFLYRTLVDTYGYKCADITVLNLDGTVAETGTTEILSPDPPTPLGTYIGDGKPYRMPITGPGTRAALFGAIDDCKARLGPDDSLLIYTTNHGDSNPQTGEAFILCRPYGDRIGAGEFAAKLRELPPISSLIVTMQQCYAGGFNAGVIARSRARHTCVASACAASRTSSAGPDFDPFSLAWISAMAGADPHGASTSGPHGYAHGRVTTLRAFRQAAATVKGDEPVFSSSGGGGSIVLGRGVGRREPEYAAIDPEIRQLWSNLVESDDPAIASALEELEELARTDRERAAAYEIRVAEIVLRAARG